MKVKVDSSKCLGCGNCVALTENSVFDFNEEGIAQVVVPEVTGELVDTVKDAIGQCPTGAIIEEEENK